MKKPMKKAEPKKEAKKMMGKKKPMMDGKKKGSKMSEDTYV
jgi:hypothetical protein